MCMEYEYQKSNREKRMAPIGGKSWCWKCDRDYIPVTQKCPTCGAAPEKRTIKKETNA